MEAREALAAYQLSVERNPTIRSFLEIAGDFGPPGERVHRLSRCFPELWNLLLRKCGWVLHRCIRPAPGSSIAGSLMFEALLACF